MHDKSRPTVSRPMRRGLYLMLPLLAAAVLVAWSAVGGSTSSATTAHSEPPVAEATLRVATRIAEMQASYEVERAFVGRVEAARSSELGFELAGRVDRVLVEEGDRVAAGQRLAMLDRQRLHSRLEELAAALDEARAGRELAAATHARVAEAADLDAVSAQEHDEARLGLRLREAAVRQLEAQIRSLEVEIAKSTLRAPYAATVAMRLVDEGEVVAAGQAILSLLEASRLEARVGTAADQAAALSPGDAIDVTVRGESFPTRVKAILPDRERRTRTVTVLLSFDAQPASGRAAVRNGDLAEVVLSRQVAESGLWLPAAALTESVRGLWACYVAEPDPERADVHLIARRDVEVLHSETDRVFVRGTLRQGERVVASGVHRLVPGQRVQIEDERAAS